MFVQGRTDIGGVGYKVYFLGEDGDQVISSMLIGIECLCPMFGPGFEWIWVRSDLVLLDVNVGRKMCIT